jgi:hypothetical protein
MHFERALDALRVGRAESRCRCGIDSCQRRMQCRPAFPGRACVDAPPYLRVSVRQSAQSFGQRLEVQHRTADEQRHAPAGADPGSRRERIRPEPCRGIRFARIDDVDQVVRDTRARRRVRLCRADVHPAVDLRGVDADDLHVEPFSERERERAFARRGRAHQQHRGSHRR